MGSPVLTSVTLDSSNAGPEEFSDLYSRPNLQSLAFVNTNYSGLPLTAIPFPDEFTVMGQTLIFFTLIGAPLNEIPPFPTNSAIQSIVIRNTLLSNLSLSQLATLPSLTYADFSGNNLSFVEARNTVALSDGLLNCIESTSSVGSLDLSNNSIRNFPSTMGCWFPNLTMFGLSNNSIEIVDFHGNFTGLYGMDLAGNNIKEIQFVNDSIIIRYSTSGSLLIEGNALESLPPKIFGDTEIADAPSSFRLFNASGNYLGRSSDPFMGASCDIVSMDVSHNEISDLSPFLKLSPSVSSIDASNNRLSYVSFDIIRNLGTGFTIVLDHNSFSRCEDIVVPPDKLLQSISVSNNSIPYLNASCFGETGAYFGAPTMSIDFSHN
eukprot:Nk52_evm1s264 gene=Nk52_evmTU1s264